MGERFTISVKADGNGLTYQWYYKDTSMEAFAISSNATATYSYTMESYRHGRQVYCVITDDHGNCVTSEIATILASDPA